MFTLFCVSEENTDGAKEEGGGPAEAIRSTCQCHCVVRFPLTSISSGERPEGPSTWCYPHSCQCRRGNLRQIRSPSSVPRNYLHRLCKTPSSLSTPLLKIVLDEWTYRKQSSRGTRSKTSFHVWLYWRHVLQRFQATLKSRGAGMN